MTVAAEPIAVSTPRPTFAERHGWVLVGLLAVVLFGLRRGERWAWAVLWWVPAMFAVHGFVLGSFPFDIVPLALTAGGLLLMVRPVFAPR